MRWIQDSNVPAPSAITERATSAVRRIATDEALADIWRTSGLLTEWRANIQDLLRRLDLASTALAPAQDNGSNGPRATAIGLAGEELPLVYRVQTFLANIAPFEGYAPGSVAEDCLHRFAAGGPWDEDARSELRICYSALMDEIESGDIAAFSDRRRCYLSECAALLREIMLEVLGDASRIDLR